jgi:hypothetical protein
MAKIRGFFIGVATGYVEKLIQTISVKSQIKNRGGYYNIQLVINDSVFDMIFAPTQLQEKELQSIDKAFSCKDPQRWSFYWVSPIGNSKDNFEIVYKTIYSFIQSEKNKLDDKGLIVLGIWLLSELRRSTDISDLYKQQLCCQTKMKIDAENKVTWEEDINPVFLPPHIIFGEESFNFDNPDSDVVDN